MAETHPTIITLTIDGQAVTVPPGTTIREAAASLGIDIPTLCHHPHFATGSNCRVCVVEVTGARTLVPACSREAEPEMQVQTDSERVRRARRVVLELLAAQADLSAAPVARAYTAYYGADPDRWAKVRAEAGGPHPAPIRDNPFFIRDYSRCIHCRRCTEACGVGIQHTFAIAVTGRGALAAIHTGGTGELPDSPCVFCGNCVGVCPTGALMALPEYESRQQGRWPEPLWVWSPRGGLKEVGA